MKRQYLKISLVILVGLFAACNTEAPITQDTIDQIESRQEEQQSTDAFVPYFLPIDDFVKEGGFDTLVYRYYKHDRVYPSVEPLVIALSQTNSKKYMQGQFYIGIPSYDEYVLTVNMPLDKKGNLIEGVYKSSLAKNELYAVTTGVLEYKEKDENSSSVNTIDVETISQSCMEIRKVDELYNIQLWLELADGQRHYILYEDCNTNGNIAIILMCGDWDK